MKNLFLILLFFLCARIVSAVEVPKEEDPFWNSFRKSRPERIKWWRKARFGIFIHWNTSSILELTSGSWNRDRTKNNRGVIKGIDLNKQLPEAIADGSYTNYMGQAGVPLEIYDNLFRIFNPSKFNAEDWASLFKAAGAKYIVFTAKHHDGFCMYDSKYTDYDIMSTPFKRDICKELADACRNVGIEVLWYYSIADWYHPACDIENPTREYDEYLHNQVRELCSNYGYIKGMWWDGGKPSMRTCDMYKMILELQPHAIMNNRVSYPRNDYITPESRLGEFSMSYPWESCIVMGRGWFWSGKGPIKSYRQCMLLLINCAGGDGNLLLDIAPRPDGLIDPPMANNLKQMGKWLSKYGESIYDTRGGPYKPGPWGVSTRKHNKVFLHITQFWPSGKLRLPPLKHKIISCTALTGGKPVFSQTEKEINITLAPKHHKDLDTIIVLELDGHAMQIEPVDPFEQKSLTIDKSVKASSTQRKNHDPGAVVLHSDEEGIMALHFGEQPLEKTKPESAGKKTTDYPWGKKQRGHKSRYWVPAEDDKKPWLEVDLGRTMTFQRVVIEERYSSISKFDLQYWDGGKWKTFYSGKHLGRFSLHCKPVTAQRVRLQILEINVRNPGIKVFDLF
ncbi:alpha-L-fucosidase [Verrucomicrobiota bacterium]